MAIQVTNLIFGQANIQNAIATLSASRKEAQAQTNLLLVSAIVHTHQHGDCTFIEPILKMAKDGGTEQKAMLAFLKKFAPVKVNQEKVGKVINFTVKVAKNKPDVNFLDSDLGRECLSTEFMDFVPEKEETAKKAFIPAVWLNNTLTSTLSKKLEKENASLSQEMRDAINLVLEVARAEALEAEKAEAIKALEAKYTQEA
ncbi:hypothetical protein [Proteus phage J3S]